MDFTSIPQGHLPEGTETPFGVIQEVSLTAYYIEDTWMPFRRIHGNPKAAEALVQISDLETLGRGFRNGEYRR